MAEDIEKNAEILADLLELEDVQRSMQAGMNANLSKPLEAEHLVQTLGELIYEAEIGN